MKFWADRASHMDWEVAQLRAQSSAAATSPKDGGAPDEQAAPGGGRRSSVASGPSRGSSSSFLDVASQAASIIRNLDVDGSGTISFEEVRGSGESGVVGAFFVGRGPFFILNLDVDGSGTISFEEMRAAAFDWRLV